MMEFRFEKGDSRAAERVAVRRALELLEKVLAPGDNKAPSMAEFERLMNQDLNLGMNVLYGLAATASAYVRREAAQKGVEPVHVLRAIERGLARSD
jgi:hypothetical protein